MTTSEKIRRRIKVDGNATYILRLPCIESAYKTPATGKITYKLFPDEEGNVRYAEEGDYLMEKRNGKWDVMRQSVYKI